MANDLRGILIIEFAAILIIEYNIWSPNEVDRYPYVRYTTKVFWVPHQQVIDPFLEQKRKARVVILHYAGATYTVRQPITFIVYCSVQE